MGTNQSVISDPVESRAKPEICCQHDQLYQAEEYKITYKRDCLIIMTTSHIDWHNLTGQVVEDRNSQQMVEKMLPELESTFNELGFMVHTLVGDITKRMAQDKIKEIMRHQNGTDMFLMYIQGHGREDGFCFRYCKLFNHVAN